MTDARLYASRPAVRPLSEAADVPASTTAIDAITRPSLTPASAPMWNLTPQQWRVFLLVGKAMSNKAIAHELNVAESTVKAHVSAIFKLAKCRNRTEAALLSQRVRYGLLDADETAALPFVALTGVKSIKHRPQYK
jgi:DNA-binding NarL/FixJ family response regulator